MLGKGLFRAVFENDLSEWAEDNEFESLYLQDNEEPFILNSLGLSQPFRFLVILNLRNNDLNTIEALSFLEAPQMSHLFLNINEICRFSTLSKSRFEELRILDLSFNPLVNPEGRGGLLAKCGSNHLKQIFLNHDSFCDKGLESETYFLNLMKLDLNGKLIVNMAHFRFVNETKFLAILSKRKQLLVFH